MMKQLMATMVGLMLVGCGVDGADSFRRGFPRTDTVKLNLPENGGALTGDAQRRDGLEGQTSEFYKLTRGVTKTVNGAGGAVLLLVEKIVEHRPTTVTDNVAVWGPHTDALSPNTFKFTVTQVAEQQYDYTLEAKAKSEPDSKFRVILSGSHVSTGERLGTGTFLVDWDRAQELPEHDENVGTASYTYSKQTAGGDVKIDALFQKVRDSETKQLVDVGYAYTEVPKAGGTFEFKMNKDWVEGAGIELLTVKSRWLQSGAGRSDAKATGGDLQGVATASECWDSAFRSRFANASWLTASTGNYGTDAVCAFPTAEYAR